MVFLAAINLALNRGPDKWWRVQQFLRFSQNFRGRKRNCYRIGMRYVHKALQYATFARKIRKIEMTKLWDTRLEASCREHGLINRDFQEGLARTNVQLDRNMLATLAIYEPRSFQSLTVLSKQTLAAEGVELTKPPTHLPLKGYARH